MDAPQTLLPQTVYGLWWTSDYAGDVPGDQLMAAALDRDDPRLAREGEATYDGVFMSTRGSFVVREHRKPGSVATLERDFAGRVRFGLNRVGEVGCWIDGKPHRLDDSGGRPAWTWDAAERDYLWAVVVRESGLSARELILSQ